MSPKPLFILATALVAPVVANIGYAGLVLSVGESAVGESRMENWLFVNGFIVVPLTVAFAGSAALFWRDRFFAQRKLPLQALGIAILAYAILPLLLLVWMPLIGLIYDRVETGVMPQDFMRDAPTVAVYTSALLFLFTALPAALFEMPVLHLVRKRLSAQAASAQAASTETASAEDLSTQRPADPPPPGASP